MIQKFLEHKKENTELLNTASYYTYYLIQVVINDIVCDGYILDADTQVLTINGQENHRLSVVFQYEVKEDTRAVLIEKSCIAPKGCQLNWDNVHCAYKLSNI